MLYIERIWELFLAFFISNILGYGGGPASIPLIYDEVVTHYELVTPQQFSNALAIGNALPGPIATKLAAVIGFEGAGILGACVALFATIFPSVLALLLLMRLISKFTGSSVVKGMTLFVQPVIAMMMVLLTWQIGRESTLDIGWVQTLLIAGFALVALVKWKWHPALVVVIAFAYGAIVLPLISA